MSVVVDPDLAADVFVVRLAGEVDVGSEPELEKIVDAFDASSCVDAVVDLAEMTFMDSTGLAMLVRLRKVCEACSGQLRVRNVGPQISSLLQATGLAGYFDS